MRDAKGRFLPDPLKECLLDAVVERALVERFGLNWRVIGPHILANTFLHSPVVNSVQRMWAGV